MKSDNRLLISVLFEASFNNYTADIIEVNESWVF